MSRSYFFIVVAIGLVAGLAGCAKDAATTVAPTTPDRKSVV